MRFASPYNLLWLVPMGGLIVAMYVLKLRRRDVVVSSTLLWRRVIRDVQANAPFQKLRRNLLLYLQLLAVVLLVLAVARPLLHGVARGGRSIVLIVDTSASMSATDVRPGRLEEARRQAIGLVREMRPEDQMLVVSAAARPEAVTGFTADPQELIRAIDGLAPRETGTNMREAVSLAAALTGGRDASQIDIVSDGAFEPVTNVNLGSARVAFHPVGRSAHNVGITALDYRHGLGADRSLQVFATIHNFDGVPRTFVVELLRGKDLADAHEVSLPLGGESPDLFELPEPDRPVALTLRIDVRDDLAADNQASLVVTPRRPIRTLAVTRGNPYLLNALRVDPDVDLSTVRPGGFRSPAGFDVVVFDGWAPAALPEGSYLFADCVSDRAPVTPGAQAAHGGIIDTDPASPVVHWVDFGATTWKRMSRGAPLDWGREVATSEAGPAIVVGDRGRTRAVWTGFGLAPDDSAFPLTVGYPILLSNAVRWLARAEAGSGAVRTGAAVVLDAPPGAGSVAIRKPDGSTREAGVQGGAAIFDDTDEAGLYTATGPGGWRKEFAASLTDFAESDIRPRADPGLGASPPGPAGRRVVVTRDLWPWLAVALLALLGIEWWVFHRRVHLA